MAATRLDIWSIISRLYVGRAGVDELWLVGLHANDSEQLPIKDAGLEFIVGVRYT